LHVQRLEEERERESMYFNNQPASWRSLVCTKIRRRERERENQCTSIINQQAGGPLYVQRLEEERKRESM
jgi:hypothetical protein